MSWTAYGIMPIDFAWEMLPTFEDVSSRFAISEAKQAISNGEFAIEFGINSYSKFMSDFENAKQLAKAQGWEGDYRENPRVFWIPDEGEFVYAFVWKQDNNGSTFVD